MPVQLQDGEVLVLLCRRHWVYLWPLLALYGLIALVAAGLAVVVTRMLDLEGTARAAALGLAGAWVLYWLVRAYVAWFRYRHDQWVITNQRLIDSQRRHWFHKEVASADLVDVQDTSVERHGLLETMLNYGDLVCQTAGQQLNFVLSGIPDPVSVLTTLDRARDQARRDVRAG